MISFARHHSSSRSSDQEGAGALVEGAGEFIAQAGGYLAEAGEVVKSVVINRPALALGAALAVGVVLGWLIKRR
jgi:hypothetical protein